MSAAFSLRSSAAGYLPLCKRLLILMLALTALGSSQSHGGTKLSVSLTPNHEIVLSVDPALHNTFGLSYPVTYQIGIPSGSAGLLAFTRPSEGASWAQLTEKFPGEFFNGEEVVRFDYAAGIAYVSAAFDSTSDQLYLKITDGASQTVDITYRGISRYYDNRRAAVTASADDWNDYTNAAFQTACNVFRSYRIPLTVAIITKRCEASTWANIQENLDLGLIEAASHNRTHQRAPVDGPEAELRGSKEDILDNLVLPHWSRNGQQQYVYTWIAPGGVTDAANDQVVTESEFLAERLVYWTDGSFMAWDPAKQRYPRDGVSTEMEAVSPGTTDLTALNGTFDDHLARGAIYHVMIHPQVLTDYDDWNKPYVVQHLQHISNRADVWYANFGYIYLYHLLQDDQAATYTQSNWPALVIDAPTNQTVTTGHPASFLGLGVGTRPLYYQWQKNGVPITGATQRSYILPTPTVADNGSLYRCVVTNASGTSSSPNALLKVLATPSSSVNAVGNGAFENGSANWQFFTNGSGNFSVTSPGNNGTGQAGQVSIAAAGTNVQLHQDGLYLEPNTDYVLTFDAYSNTGHDVQLILGSMNSPYTNYGLSFRPFDITTSWQNYRVTFTTKGFSSPISDAGLGFWLAPDGKPGDVYTIDNVVLEKLSDYSPITAPTIDSGPVSQTVTAGQTATFTVSATGTAPLSYQWQKNGSDLAGATGSSFTTASTSAADSGALFRCRVSNGAGTVTSAEARLTVITPRPALVTIEPRDTTVSDGRPASFTLTASGDAPLAYQWQKNGADIAGATTRSYSIVSAARADSGAAFRCIVSNAVGKDTSRAALLRVLAIAPTITLQPTAQTVTAGQTASFQVRATGTAPLHYQWQKDTVNIPGATDSLYTTPPVVTADSGRAFRCVVSNTAGAVPSSAARLTVITPRPAKITLAPHDTTVLEGHPASFTIGAAGDAPVTYQWQKNGADISGATASSYSIASAARTDSGAAFRCITSNVVGNDTSLAALLHVLPVPPVITTQPVARTVNAGQTATFSIAASGSRPVTYQWQRDTVNVEGATDSLYSTPPAATADSGITFRCLVSNVAGSVASAAARLTVITPYPPLVTIGPRDTTVQEGHVALFTVVAAGTAPFTYQWQKNGVSLTGATASSYNIASAVRADSGTAFRCIVSNAVGKDTSAIALLHVVPVPPVITMQPVARTVNYGQTATFSVVATGTAPLTYQWKKDTVAIAGATDSVYTTAAVVTADSGTLFHCVVSNAAGSVTSTGARLTVITPYPPMVTVDPRDTTVQEGRAALFTVAAAGTAPFTYQWQKNETDIAGATGSTYSLASAPHADSGAAFRCIVTNAVGKDTSSAALLCVLPVPPAITLQPAAKTVDATQTATFWIIASGTRPLSYQWQRDTVDISGATDSSYTTTATSFADSGVSFRCVVHNIAGAAVSTGARLTVITPYPAVVTLDPRDTTVQEGRAAQFVVSGSGTTPLSYQWQKNGTTLAGATAPTYNIASAARSDSGAAFRCIVSNAAGKDTSAAALLHVLPVPPLITTQPLARTVSAGQTATFSVTATGSAPLTYQWQKNGTDIGGAKDSLYTTPGTTAADSGALYRCFVFNSAGKDTSNQARLTVISTYPAVVTIDPRDTVVTDGRSASFTVSATGTGTISYRWQKNGTDLSGATAASYTINAAAFADSGSAFRCIVSNSVGKDTSAAALLRVLPVPPTITLQPSSASVLVGYTSSFSVAATGTGTLSYQWQKNGAPISGATSPTYTTPTTSLSDNGATFRCVVANRGGTVTSQSAVLTVNTPPAIPSAVSNGTFESGTTGWTFYSNGAATAATSAPGSSGSGLAMLVNVTSEGTNVQLYQPGITLQAATSYQLSFDAYCSTGHDVDVSLGQHGAPYTNYGLAGQLFNLTSAWQTFSVTFTTAGFAGSVSDARLMFWLAPYDAAGDRYYFDNIQLAKTTDLAPTPPVVTLQPANQTINAGQTATFSITATGTTPLSYQWQKNSVDIGGATGASYTTPAVTRADSGAFYRCKVTNIATSVFSNPAQLSVITPQPPLVTLEPRDTTVLEGRPASFTVTATGTVPLAYQWQKNGANLSGATAATYSISSAARTDSGAAFRCIVSNSVGRDTSVLARLSVLAIPPAIATQPVNQSVTASQAATFSVTATGSAPLTYQWQRNTVDISAATSASYTTPAVTAADSGALFRCRVNNAVGSVISSQALLSVVIPQPAVVSVEPHDTTVTEGRPASFAVTATGTATITYQWQKNGTNISGASASSYNIASAVRADSGAAFRCIVSNSAGKDTSIAARLRVLAVPPTITTQPVAQSVTIGQTATFSLVASGSTPLAYQWQKNSTNIVGATSASYTTAATVIADSGATFRCIVSNSGGSVTSQAALLTVNRAPTVIPNAVSNGTFEAGTTGWTFYSNGSAAYATSSPGSSGSVLAMLVNVTSEGTNVQLYQAGISLEPNTSYQLSFDAYCNTGHDVEVSLGQHGAPYTNYGLVNRPIDLTTAWQNFSVTFTTTGFSGSVSDARLMFWLASYDAAGDRYYFDNVQLAKTSDLAPSAPTITTQPVAQSVTTGQTATFSVTATGTAPLSYQWQKNSADISGATGTSFTTAAVTAADNGSLFRCRVSNTAGSVTSSQALLSVATPQPALVTTEPQDTTVIEGSPASFTVTATGTATITYQWQKNGTNISGATASSYSIASAARADSGAAFRCIVSNSAGKDTSIAALLKVLAVPPAITTQPVAQSVTVGQTATFSVTATGSAPLSFQWQRNGTAISGATSASYTTVATVIADSGATFRCIVSNSGGSVTSQATLLIVDKATANLLVNGTFENGTTSWTFYTNGAGSYATVSPGSSGAGNALQVSISTEGTNVQLFQAGVTVQANTSYQLSFDAYSNTGHNVEVSLGQHGAPYTNYGLLNRPVDLTTGWQNFSVTFTTSGFTGSVSDARLMFWLAPYDAAGDRYGLDNIVLATAPALKEVPGEGEVVPPLAGIIPGDFVLEGNFPNPFNPSTTIRYGLPEPATVSIIVYSLLGQEVTRLTYGYQAAGSYQVTWQGRREAGGTVSSGVYLCRMVATPSSGKAYVATKRMVLMK
jgi:hypothetical protein